MNYFYAQNVFCSMRGFYCTVATEDPKTSSCNLLYTQKDNHPELKINSSFTICHNYLPVQCHYFSFSMLEQHLV